MKYYRMPPSPSTILTVVEVRKIHFSGMDAAFEWMASEGHLWNLNSGSIPHTLTQAAAHSTLIGPTYTELLDANAQQQQEISRLLAEVAELTYTNHALTTQTNHLNNNILQSCRTQMEDQQLILHLQTRVLEVETQLQQSENGQLLANQDELMKDLHQKFDRLADQKYQDLFVLRQHKRGLDASGYETDLYHALTQHQAQQHKDEYSIMECKGKLRLSELENVFLKNRVAQLQQNASEYITHIEQYRNDNQQRDTEIQNLQMALRNSQSSQTQQGLQGCRHNADREAELKTQSSRLSTAAFIHWLWHKYPPPLPFDENQFGHLAAANKEERFLIRKALLYYHGDKYTVYDDRVRTIAGAVCQTLTAKLSQ